MSEADAEEHAGIPDGIVVGLDDSPAGRAALRWAADQARLMGQTLRAVAIIDWPTGMTAAGSVVSAGMVNLSGVEVSTEYRNAVQALFNTVNPERDWKLQFEMGKAAQVLVRESRSARLLVVGTGEHVGLGRVLIGSTSHYCLSHAFCPVVAVPSREHQEGT